MGDERRDLKGGQGLLQPVRASFVGGQVRDEQPEETRLPERRHLFRGSIGRGRRLNRSRFLGQLRAYDDLSDVTASLSADELRHPSLDGLLKSLGIPYRRVRWNRHLEHQGVKTGAAVPVVVAGLDQAWLSPLEDRRLKLRTLELCDLSNGRDDRERSVLEGGHFLLDGLTPGFSRGGSASH